MVFMRAQNFIPPPSVFLFRIERHKALRALSLSRGFSPDDTLEHRKNEMYKTHIYAGSKALYTLNIVCYIRKNEYPSGFGYEKAEEKGGFSQFTKRMRKEKKNGNNKI